jgi:hypothetical protein
MRMFKAMIRKLALNVARNREESNVLENEKERDH